MSLMGDPLFIAAEQQYRFESMSVTPRIDRAARVGGTSLFRTLQKPTLGLLAAWGITMSPFAEVHRLADTGRLWRLPVV